MQPQQQDAQLAANCSADRFGAVIGTHADKRRVLLWSLSGEDHGAEK